MATLSTSQLLPPLPLLSTIPVNRSRCRPCCLRCGCGRCGCCCCCCCRDSGAQEPKAATRGPGQEPGLSWRQAAAAAVTTPLSTRDQLRQLLTRHPRRLVQLLRLLAAAPKCTANTQVSCGM
jgi:hypothetical protein